jgi:membrane protein required for colicin V production
MSDLAWLDGVWLIALALSVVLGLLRGVVQEVMSVLGWLVAWLAAQAWGGPLGQSLPGPAGGSTVQLALGFAATFAVVLLGWRVLAWLLQKIVHATPLAPVDRLLGGVFGVMRGVLIVAVMVALVDFTPLARQPFWQTSIGVRWAHVLIESVRPLVALRPAPERLAAVAPHSGSPSTLFFSALPERRSRFLADWSS